MTNRPDSPSPVMFGPECPCHSFPAKARHGQRTCPHRPGGNFGDIRSRWSFAAVIPAEAGIHESQGVRGLPLSTGMGQRMTQVMAGQPDANVCEGLDRPTIPGDFAFGRGLPLVGAYYRLQDILR